MDGTWHEIAAQTYSTVYSVGFFWPFVRPKHGVLYSIHEANTMLHVMADKKKKKGPDDHWARVGLGL